MMDNENDDKEAALGSPNSEDAESGSCGDDGKKGVRQMFSTEEDNKLIDLVREFGDKNWRIISKHMPNRTTRQCRERYRNYLSPKVTNGPWTAEEDLLLEQKYIEYGPKWATIAQFFKSRSDVNIKNRWASNRHKATRTAATFSSASQSRSLIESLFVIQPSNKRNQFFNTIQQLNQLLSLSAMSSLKKQQNLAQSQQKSAVNNSTNSSINNNSNNNNIQLNHVDEFRLDDVDDLPMFVQPSSPEGDDTQLLTVENSTPDDFSTCFDNFEITCQPAASFPEFDSFF